MTFQVGLNLKGSGGVANVKGVIAQVSFSIIWLHISYLVSLKSYLGPKRLHFAFICAPQLRNSNNGENFVTVVNCVTLAYKFLSITFRSFIFNHTFCIRYSVFFLYSIIFGVFDTGYSLN